MPFFRKKPVVIEAVQWTGTNIDDLWELDPDKSQPFTIDGAGHTMIRTIEGAVIPVAPGTWIIRGVLGEFYPCVNAAFQQSYEPIGP